MDPQGILDFLEKYCLKPATKRNLSLLLFSFIAQGYSSKLKTRLGFNYKALAAIGDKIFFHSLVNESLIVSQMKDLMSQEMNVDQTILQPTINKIREISRDLDQTESRATEHPWECLESIFRLCPEYMSCLGVYNCFLRFVGDESEQNLLSPDTIKLISSQRDEAAILYPRFEKMLNFSLSQLSEKLSLNLSPLRMMTYSEMKKLLSDHSIENVDFKTLKERENGYYYQFIEGESPEEIVVTDSNIMEALNDSFSPYTNKNKLEGKTAFGGLARGKVIVLRDRKDSLPVDMDGKIFVCSMTHPDDLPLIKKCAAVVTDEGGILSHAAIIARELKKPCIIGTKIATKVLKNGDEVEVDADKGIVRIIKKV